MHFADTAFYQSDLFCSGATEVDCSSAYKWSAIIDPHDYRTAIAGVCNAHFAAEWQCFVRGSKLARIKPFTAGCWTACEASTVVGGMPDAQIAQHVSRSRLADRFKLCDVNGVFGVIVWWRDHIEFGETVFKRGLIGGSFSDRNLWGFLSQSQ